MGKYIVMYVLPAMILLPAIWLGVGYWYRNKYGSVVKTQIKTRKATKKYEDMLKEGNYDPR